MKILTGPDVQNTNGAQMSKILAKPKIQNTGEAQNAKYWRVKILAVRPLKNDFRLAHRSKIVAKPKMQNTDE